MVSQRYERFHSVLIDKQRFLNENQPLYTLAPDMAPPMTIIEAALGTPRGPLFETESGHVHNKVPM